MLLQIRSPDTDADKMVPSVSAQTILGDATSMLHIQGNQTFYIEYTQAAERRALPPVNFQIDQYGELFLVPDFRIIGLHDRPFYLDGQLSGVYNMTVAEKKELVVGPHATNAQLNNGSYVEEPTLGKFYNNNIKFYCKCNDRTAQHTDTKSTNIIMHESSMPSQPKVSRF